MVHRVDWNVRYPHERLGGGQLSMDIKVFSDWINLHTLIDLPLKIKVYLVQPSKSSLFILPFIDF